jgi:hypothetical protein
VPGGVRLQRSPTGRRVAQGDSDGRTMFQTLKDRFSKDDDAKAERKARKAELVAKRREVKAELVAQERERRARMAGKESGQ